MGYDSSREVYVGNSNSLAVPFNGSIDEVMIFNRVLSENEIKNIYNSQKDNYQ